jgi:hypothetical protein
MRPLLLAAATLALCTSRPVLSQIALPEGNGDLGAQVNAAMAALPTSGGKVVIHPQSGGQCYTFTVPIVMTKAVILEGEGPATCLQFTGSGAAISISSVWPSFIPANTTVDGFGIRDLTLLGSGPNAGQTGLALGTTTTQSPGFYATGMTLGSFGLGLQFNQGAWNFKIEHSVFARNGQNVYWPSTLQFGGENMEFDSVTFIGATFANSLEFNDESSSYFSNLENLTFVSCNFDDAQLVINNGSGGVRLYAPHFENPLLLSGSNPFMIIRAFTAASDVVLDGPDFYNDSKGPYPASFLEIDGSPTVTISQLRSTNLDGSTNVPTNILIAGDAKVTLLGDAPLRAAQQEYTIASGNPSLWVMGSQNAIDQVQSTTPMLFSQTYTSTDSESPVVEIGGTDYSPTVGFDLWTGTSSSFYKMQIKETGPNELDFCTGGAAALHGSVTYNCNAGVVNGVFTNTVPDGTPPLNVASHTPPNNLNAWPATFDPNGNQILSPHVTTGKIVLPASGQATVSFFGSARFTQTPWCSVSYQTGTAMSLAPLSFNPNSSQITIFGQQYIGVYYLCVGN